MQLFQNTENAVLAIMIKVVDLYTRGRDKVSLSLHYLKQTNNDSDLQLKAFYAKY